MASSSSLNPFGEAVIPRSLDNERLFAAWFQLADSDNDGKLTGADAVAFFERSGLPRPTLAKVWTLADAGRRGFLDRRGFAKAMELIGIAQRSAASSSSNGGEDLSAEAYAAAAARADLDPPVLAGVGGAAGGAGGKAAAAAASAAAGGGGSDDGGGGGGGSAQPSPRTTAAASGAASPSGSGAPSPQQQQQQYAYARASQQQGQGNGRPSLGGRGSSQQQQPSMKTITGVVDGLKQIYFSKVKPVEEAYKFGSFFSACLTESDFDAKPSVLLLGQYSTGKTTFIEHLLGRKYPGANIGPEPSTDRVVAISHALEDRRTPGATLAVNPSLAWGGLAAFGNSFLARFEGAGCNAPSGILKHMTLVDTPGILSGEKQRIARSFDFVEVCSWFAARCDLILLLFDPAKLDVSDEFKEVITSLRGHDDKVRVVLNKSDSVDMQQLMRVYGALLWSLAKVFRSPEVCRVYVGSFNADKPPRTDVNPTGAPLFKAEAEDLMSDLYAIPARAADRKVNEFVKRVRAAKIHVLILGHLRRALPVVGRAKAQAALLADLPNIFAKVAREHHLPAGDFPDPARYASILRSFELSSFPKLKEKDVRSLEQALSVDVPALVQQFDNPYGAEEDE